MSFNPLNVALNQPIKPSLQKSLLIIVPHLIGIIIVLSFTVFSLWLKLQFIVIVLASGFYYTRLHLLQKSKKSVISIQQDSAKNWFISTHDKGHEVPPKSVILSASSFGNKYLIVLNYRDINKSYYSAIITPDSISNNDFRRLQVRLSLTNIKKS